MKHFQASSNDDFHHKKGHARTLAILVPILHFFIIILLLGHPIQLYPLELYYFRYRPASLATATATATEAQSIKIGEKCNLTSGNWVRNMEAPYYTNVTCSAIQESQNCMKHGSPDAEYLKWRWQPDGCDLPIFNPVVFLEMVGDKFMAFVWVSVYRNHMQSLMCLLSQVENPVDESYTSSEQFKRWNYKSYNFTLATFWTPFMVKAEYLDSTHPTLFQKSTTFI